MNTNSPATHILGSRGVDLHVSSGPFAVEFLIDNRDTPTYRLIDREWAGSKPVVFERTDHLPLTEPWYWDLVIPYVIGLHCVKPTEVSRAIDESPDEDEPVPWRSYRAETLLAPGPDGMGWFGGFDREQLRWIEDRSSALREQLEIIDEQVNFTSLAQEHLGESKAERLRSALWANLDQNLDAVNDRVWSLDQQPRNDLVVPAINKALGGLGFERAARTSQVHFQYVNLDSSDALTVAMRSRRFPFELCSLSWCEEMTR